jgi:hypothetical protein
MKTPKYVVGVLIAIAATGLSGCTSYDRAAGTNTSGAYPAQSDGRPGNPAGTKATRALDRAAGTDVSGAYPGQRDGTAANPPGTAAQRLYDRSTGTNTSGAYPQNVRPGAPVR